MSVHIDYDKIVDNIDYDKIVDNIIRDILNTMPSYMYEYKYKDGTGVECGFYPYICNLITYILNGLRPVFDLQLNLYNSRWLLKTNINVDLKDKELTNKSVIYAQKTCENIGITNTNVDAFVSESGDEQETIRMRIEYLQALYNGTILGRLFNGTLFNYNQLLSAILPDGAVIAIDDGGARPEPNYDPMVLGINIDAAYSSIYQYIDKEIIKQLLTPKNLGVGTSLEVADTETLYWNGKIENNEDQEKFNNSDGGNIDNLKTSGKQDKLDEKNWIAEY